MIRGIGIDTVSISEIEALFKRLRPQTLAKIFSDAEMTEANVSMRPAEYLAARFAVKEAVFKAVAHLLESRHFDLRIVETLHDGDGSPCLSLTPAMKRILHDAGVERVHISVTTEGDIATAFAVAE